MTFLQNTSGKISPTHLMGKEDELKEFIYNSTQPIDVIFNSIDCFASLYELVKDLIPNRRKVNLGYKLISKNSAIKDSLKAWNKKDANARNYTAMNLFMRNQYNKIDKVGSLSVDNSSLSQSSILQELKDHQE